MVIKTRTKIFLRIMLFVTPVLALAFGAQWAFLTYGEDYSLGVLQVSVAWILGGIIGYTIVQTKKKHEMETKGENQHPPG